MDIVIDFIIFAFNSLKIKVERDLETNALPDQALIVIRPFCQRAIIY